jgi:hypothetical protein
MFKMGKTSTLVAKSKSAMSTFTATLANLRAINDEAQKEDATIANEQAILQKERDTLAKVIEDNGKVAKKIEEFLS